MHVVPPSALVGKVIENKYLMSVAFYMVMVLDTHLLCILVVFIDAVRKLRRKFGLEHVFVSGARE